MTTSISSRHVNRHRALLAVSLLAAAFAVASGLHVARDLPAARAVEAQPVPSRERATAAAANARRQPLSVAFRLDPELTQGVFLGERWVSPPSFFFAQPGTQYVVRAKAQTIDGHGDRTDVRADWAPANPEMVAVDRGDLGEVTVVVRQPGESDLTVSAGSSARVLHVSATRTADAMQVDFSQ
jgi:hypothetical protein